MNMYAMKLRLRIVVRCASVVLADRSLVVFPLISMSFTVVVLCFFYFTVGPDKMQLMLNTLRNEQGIQTINMGYYGALGTALFIIVTLATAMNFALINCIRISLDKHNSRVWDGFSVVLKRFPDILLWSFLSITLGLLWTLFDQERRSSAFLRRRFGNTWNNMSVLTVPASVLENRNIFGSIFRSRTCVQDTWGLNLTAHFGSLWFVVILSLPLVVKYAFLQFSGTGITLPFAEFVLVYLACSIILAQTINAIFKVVLYCYASEGLITAGFDADSLKNAFESPYPGVRNTSPAIRVNPDTRQLEVVERRHFENGAAPEREDTEESGDNSSQSPCAPAGEDDVSDVDSLPADEDGSEAPELAGLASAPEEGGAPEEGDETPLEKPEDGSPTDELESAPEDQESAQPAPCRK